MDGFLSLEDITHFSISHTVFGRFTSAVNATSLITENLTFKAAKTFKFKRDLICL